MNVAMSKAMLTSGQKLEEARNKFFLRASRVGQSCQHLDFRILASRNLRVNFCCLKHPVCILLWQPQETDLVALDGAQECAFLTCTWVILMQVLTSLHWTYVGLEGGATCLC